MKANPAIATAVEQLVKDYKEFSDTNPGEEQLRLEQRILEAKIHDLQIDADTKPKDKAGMMFDRIVESKNLERKLRTMDTPMEFFLDTYHDTSVPMDLRIKAATACMAYVHRKLPNQVEVTGKDGGAIEVTHTARDKMMTVLFENEVMDAEIIYDEELESSEANTNQGDSNED